MATRARSLLALAALAVLTATTAIPAAAAPPAPSTAAPATGPAATAVATNPALARPGATTTGVTPGTALTAMVGGRHTAAGTVIQNKVITGDALFTGSDLTLRNVRITGKADFRGRNVVIENAELGGLVLSDTSNVRVANTEVFGTPGVDGVHITSYSKRVQDVLLENVWIHGAQPTPTAHYDGIQVRGVDRLTLRGVSIELGEWRREYNAALFLENANGGNTAVRVEDSWIVGGGFSFYSFASDVRVVRTVFAGGRWGHLYPKSPAGEIREFTGNRDGAGTLLKVGTSSAGAAFVAGAPAMPAAEADAVVSALYQDLLGRGTDPGGLATWSAVLQGGTSQSALVQALTRSDEYINLRVAKAYREVLGREPEPAGARDWLLAVRSGPATVDDVQLRFYDSAEYFAISGGTDEGYVRRLYQTMLRRPAGAGEVSMWVGVMRTHGRSHAANSIWFSTEAAAVRTSDYYSTFLGRAPDAGGVATWSRVLLSHGEGAVRTGIAGSLEYRQRAVARYP